MPYADPDKQRAFQKKYMREYRQRKAEELKRVKLENQLLNAMLIKAVQLMGKSDARLLLMDRILNPESM